MADFSSFVKYHELNWFHGCYSILSSYRIVLEVQLKSTPAHNWLPWNAKQDLVAKINDIQIAVMFLLVTRLPIRRVLDNDQLHLRRFCLNTVTSWSCHFRGAHLQWVIQNYIGLKWLHYPLPSSCSVCLRGGTSSRNSKSTGCGRWGRWLFRRSGRFTSSCTNGS